MCGFICPSRYRIKSLFIAAGRKESSQRWPRFTPATLRFLSIRPIGVNSGTVTSWRIIRQILRVLPDDILANPNATNRPTVICLRWMNFVDVANLQKCLHQSVPIGENCLLEKRLRHGRFKAELAPSRFNRLEAAGGKEFFEGGGEIVAGLLHIA